MIKVPIHQNLDKFENEQKDRQSTGSKKCGLPTAIPIQMSPPRFTNLSQKEGLF